MPRTGRPGLSAQQKKELWNRWKDGQSLSEIGRALGKHAGSIHTVLSALGGIAPRERYRRPDALTEAEREEISRSLAAGCSLRSIASQLGRAPSTICREVNRNGGLKRYRAASADQMAWDQARRPKPCKLAVNNQLNMLVADRLAKDWSPQQIAGWLAKHYGQQPEMRVSHETIYRCLFVQARGVLKKELIARLRSRRMMRRGKTSSTEGQPRGRIIDAVSIHDRPADVEDRTLPGHWEGDLLSGAKNTHIATLVERRSRYVTLVKLAGKDTESVVNALIREVSVLPEGAMQTLTWDRGSELAQHKRFTASTGVKMYFCDPRSPWQRGTNENTNRLLRQYFPDGTNLAEFSQEDLNAVAWKLNTRPRKTLAYIAPIDKLAEPLR
jgi:IS30 family transposase